MHDDDGVVAGSTAGAATGRRRPRNTGARKPRRPGATGRGCGRYRAVCAGPPRAPPSPGDWRATCRRSGACGPRWPSTTASKSISYACRCSGCGISTGVAEHRRTMAAPFGQAGVRTIASSPGSRTQRIATFRACTPEAVTTISLAGSSVTEWSLAILVGDGATETRQPGIGRVVRVALLQGPDGRVLDVLGVWAGWTRRSRAGGRRPSTWRCRQAPGCGTARPPQRSGRGMPVYQS